MLVLNVHAVMDGAGSRGANPESTVLPVKLFGADMQMLRDAGYHTVTPEQITAWRAGVLELPHDALLLTFDDGRTDTVLNAAPILKKVGMRATVFAIGGAWKRSPLYEASPESLRSLQRQGWSIEAHASAPHGGIERRGKDLPYLSARRSEDGHLETLGQFRDRAANEYRDAREAAEKIANRPVVAFAWPFGAYGADTRTNDPRVAGINLAEARRVYSLGFNEDGQSTFGLLTQADRSHAHRALRDRPHPHAASALRAPRARDRGIRPGGLACVVATRSRGQVALAASATWPPRALAWPPPRATAGAAAPAAAFRRPRPAGGPIVLALTATHPSSAALGSLSAHLSSIGLLSPAWLTLQPGGRFAYNAADRSRQGLTQRGARLVPVLADPERLCRRAARRTAPCDTAGVRLDVALRALDARGIVLDWRDLPPRRAHHTRSSCTSCAPSSARARSSS